MMAGNASPEPCVQFPGCRVDLLECGPGGVELHLSGKLTYRQIYATWPEVRGLIGSDRRRVCFDLSKVETLDGGATGLLLALKHDLDAAGIPAEIIGAHDGVQRMLDLYGGHPPRPSLRSPPTHIGILDQIGRDALSLFAESRSLDYLGDVALATTTAVRNPRSINWPDVWRVMERAGADAVPIVALLTFLVGLVTGFQAAIQLKQFGANIFVADLVALSITRELGPLMTAIIVAGRSGAAFAAELGTMRVSEEVDALVTLGLDPYRFLVLPRVLALLVVTPLLTFLADLCGILGGLLVALITLDLTASSFLRETRSALELWDIGSGLVKSVAFGLVLALIACQRGLATKGGAEGVGRAATSAVVTSLFALVLMDALFTILFNAFGL
jgi:phospholipid/cholesterol/gamma-HCH transport system permease protein